MKSKPRFMIAIIIPIFSIILQGCYFNWQIALALCLLGVLILFDKPSISRIQFISILIVILGLILSDLLFGNIQNSFFEIAKLSCLFLPILLSDTDNKNGLLLGLYWGSCISSLIGFMAYVLHFDKFELVQNISGLTRVQGSFGYANTMAVYCGIGMILSIYYLKRNENYRFLNEILLIINGICLFMTGSKLGMAALVFSIIVTLCVKYKKLIPYAFTAFILVILCIVILFVVGKENIIIGPTLASRLIYWYDAIGVFFRNPFGIGVYGWQGLQYKIQTANYSVKYVHNGFLQLVLDGGILSFLGILLIFIMGIISTVNHYLKKKKDLYLYLLAILLLVLVHSLVDIDFAYGAVWLSLGIVLSFVKSEELKINKYMIFAILLLLSINCIVAQVDTTNQVDTIAIEFNTAYNNKDYEKMYKASKEWVTEAPRQQYAYDAYLISLSALNKQEELNVLYQDVIIINESMNSLCRYITQHQKIILPRKD